MKESLIIDMLGGKKVLNLNGNFRKASMAIFGKLMGHTLSLRSATPGKNKGQTTEPVPLLIKNTSQQAGKGTQLWPDKQKKDLTIPSKAVNNPMKKSRKPVFVPGLSQEFIHFVQEQNANTTLQPENKGHIADYDIKQYASAPEKADMRILFVLQHIVTSLTKQNSSIQKFLHSSGQKSAESGSTFHLQIDDKALGTVPVIIRRAGKQLHIALHSDNPQLIARVNNMEKLLNAKTDKPYVVKLHIRFDQSGENEEQQVKASAHKQGVTENAPHFKSGRRIKNSHLLRIKTETLISGGKNSLEKELASQIAGNAANKKNQISRGNLKNAGFSGGATKPAESIGEKTAPAVKKDTVTRETKKVAFKTPGPQISAAEKKIKTDNSLTAEEMRRAIDPKPVSNRKPMQRKAQPEIALNKQGNTAEQKETEKPNTQKKTLNAHQRSETKPSFKSNLKTGMDEAIVGKEKNNIGKQVKSEPPGMSRTTEPLIAERRGKTEGSGVQERQNTISVKASPKAETGFSIKNIAGENSGNRADRSQSVPANGDKTAANKANIPAKPDQTARFEEAVKQNLTRQVSVPPAMQGTEPSGKTRGKVKTRLKRDNSEIQKEGKADFDTKLRRGASINGLKMAAKKKPEPPEQIIQGEMSRQKAPTIKSEPVEMQQNQSSIRQNDLGQGQGLQPGIAGKASQPGPTSNASNASELIARIQEITALRHITRQNGQQTSRIVYEDRLLGKVEMQYKEHKNEKKLTIFVENKKIQHDLQKMLPHVSDTLQQKGIELSSFRIDIGAFAQKEQMQEQKNQKKSTPKSNYVKEKNDDAKPSPVTIRKYGYNTMEVVA